MKVNIHIIVTQQQSQNLFRTSTKKKKKKCLENEYISTAES